MSIEPAYNRGRISFDFESLLRQLSPLERLAVAEVVACEDAVIEFVAQQIIQRWTDNGYHGAVFASGQADPTTGLDKVWRDVAKASGDIARREIERLEAALRWSEERRRELISEQVERTAL